MENQFRHHENRNQSQLPSPTTTASNCNGVYPGRPSAPRPLTRPDVHPCPTTFVQADTASFKQVVQMLTGSSDTVAAAAKAPPSDPPPPHRNHPIPLIRAGPKKPQSGFKLYKRRNSLKSLKICPLIPGFAQNPGFSPGNLSPSMLDFPSLALSPVTPLTPDPFNRPAGSAPKADPNLDPEAEERAIAEKGFFLHPSPSATPRESEPRLLPLFPLTSPKLSGSSSS